MIIGSSWNEDWSLPVNKNEIIKEYISMSLLEKLAKVGIKSGPLTESEVYFDREVTSIDQAPIVNVALGGELDSGIGSGVTVLAGPSKHFKSNTGLLCVAAYLKKHKDAICLFYDSEYGAPPDYWANFGIDITRVLHCPVEDIEDIKFDLPQKLEQISKKEKVIIFVDSIGNLASKKEAQDALDGKAVTDMTRARELKSMFRIITPKIKIRNIPAIFIAHTYQTMEMYSKAVVSGGTGIYYSADTIIIFGRQQEKEGTDLAGFNFILNVEKSRFTKEKSKIPLTVLFEGGINKFSGIMDLALESGHVVKPKNGWYALVDTETGEVGDSKRFNQTQTENFLGKVLANDSFREFVKNKYKLQGSNQEVSEEALEDYSSDEDVIEE